MFRMSDLVRLNPSGSGTINNRLKQIYGGTGTLADRESFFLTAKGHPPAVGTKTDRWRRYLAVPAGVRIQQVIRGLAALP